MNRHLLMLKRKRKMMRHQKSVGRALLGVQTFRSLSHATTDRLNWCFHLRTSRWVSGLKCGTYVADHMTVEQAADAVLDRFKRIFVSELVAKLLPNGDIL